MVSPQAPTNCTTHSGNLIGYTLKYRETGGWYVMVEVDGGNVTAQLLTGLQQKSIKYEIQVAANTSQGAGPYSMVVTATTIPATKPGLLGSGHS